MRTPLIALTLLAVATTASAASDDLTVVSSNTNNGKAGAATTSYMGSDHVRMASGDGHESLIDLATGVMTLLDGKKKTYYTVTKQDLEQLSAKMQERMNSPEMKKGMEFMKNMAGAVASSYEVKKTGVTRTVAGYSCEEWTIGMPGLSTTHECLTTALQYPAHAFGAFQDLSRSMQGAMSAMSPMAKSGAELTEKLKAMKGFPIATSTVVEIMGMKTTTASEVIEVRRGQIPASAWEIPAGYAQIENPMLKALERGSHGRPAA
jgi:hypothetical protein